MALLHSQDYEDIIRLASAVLAADPWKPAWQLVLTNLVTALNGTLGYLSNYDWTQQKAQAEALSSTDLDLAAVGDFTEQNVALGHPTGHYYARSGDDKPMSTRLLTDWRRWRASENGRYVQRTMGSTDLLTLPLAVQSDWQRGFVLHRDSGVFSERDLAYATHAQVILRAIDRHYAVLNRWADSRRSTVRRQDPADLLAGHLLTTREITVLTLLANAMTATAVGHKLGISTRTVHKHIENLYRKLGTRDRLETILRAQALGILPSSAEPKLGPF